MATNFNTYNTDYNPITGERNVKEIPSTYPPEISLPVATAEHLQKLVCHEIHRIRWRLSSPWLPVSEKEAIESELWLLTDIEKELDDQL